jgi:transposase for insertion sequence element IS21-like
VNEQHFQPVFCRKSDPESKGKIENVVKYVKYNFLRGRTFHSIDQLNKEALEWLERTGNGNEHSLTHLIPSEEFQIERNCLQPYHGIPTEPRQKMKEYYVRKDNTICYHSNFYTLPCGTYKGQSTTVWVQESEEERLEIFDKETGKQITSHPLCKEKGKTVSNMAHHRVRNVPREDMEKRIVDYAGGDSIASEWMNGLRAGKPRYYWDNLNHILRFMRTFSRETFHEAMEICLDRGAYNALMLTDTARSIQKRKKEKPADLPPMSTATIPTVAQEMPEKTNINQYSSIFK